MGVDALLLLYMRRNVLVVCVGVWRVAAAIDSWKDAYIGARCRAHIYIYIICSRHRTLPRQEPQDLAWPEGPIGKKQWDGGGDPDNVVQHHVFKSLPPNVSAVVGFQQNIEFAAGRTVVTGSAYG